VPSILLTSGLAHWLYIPASAALILFRQIRFLEAAGLRERRIHPYGAVSRTRIGIQIRVRQETERKREGGRERERERERTAALPAAPESVAAAASFRGSTNSTDRAYCGTYGNAVPQLVTCRALIKCRFIEQKVEAGVANCCFLIH